MRRLIQFVALALLVAATSSAQVAAIPTPGTSAASVAASPAPAGAYPQYLVAFGASYNQYAAPGPLAAGWISASMETGANTGMYSITTVDLTQTSSSLRTGIAKVLARSGNFTLLAHADGGITTGAVGSSAVTLGSFSGGATVTYDLGGLFKHLKGDGVYAIGVVRILAVTSTNVQPVFEFGFGKAF